MRNLIQIIRRLIKPGRPTRATPLPSEAPPKIARQIEATHDIEYSCDDVLHLLDQFAEAVLRGEDVARLMPLVQRHLDMCPDCREEFEALMRVLRASGASTA